MLVSGVHLNGIGVGSRSHFSIRLNLKVVGHVRDQIVHCALQFRGRHVFRIANANFSVARYVPALHSVALYQAVREFGRVPPNK